MPLFFMAITLNLKGDSQDPNDLVEVPEVMAVQQAGDEAAAQEEPESKPKASSTKARK